MATWDEIKKNRQASVKVNEPVSTWDEIKYQRGWKPEEEPSYKAVKPALKYASWALEKQDEAINLYDKYAPKPTAPVQMPQSIKGVPETDPGRVLYDVAMESRALTPHDYMSEYEQLQQKYDLQSKAMSQSVNVDDSYRKLLALSKEINTLRQKADLAGTPISEKVNPVEAALDQFFQGGPEQFFAGIYGGISAAEEFLVNTAKGLFGGEKDHVSGARQDALDFQQAYQERLEKNTAGLSPLERGAVGLSQAAGNMLFGAGMTGAAGLPAHFSNATKVAISAGAGGESYITALQKGANIDQAAAYGLLAGATEYIAESLFGGNPLTDKAGTGLVSRLVKKLGGSSKLLGFLASKPVDMLSEGIEEIISEVLNPVWEYLTFNKNPEWASLEQVLEAGINGVVLSGVLQGGSSAINAAINLTGNAPSAATIELDTKQTTIIEKILQGEEISGNQAEIIAKSPEAIAVLTQITGQEINTDAPISSLKREIRALANGQAAITDTSPTVDTPTQRSAQRAAETPVTAYGKAGQKAINELYLQNQSREQYQADMSRFYQAGVTGTKFENVPYTGILTEPQRRGAYIAGQADAEISLAEEKYNAQFATVYKDDAGLIRNDYTPELTKDETSFINTLFKAAGVKGEFVAPTGNKGANGWIDGGIVKIAQDAADPLMVVAKHEITHRMQDIAPEEYRQYRDYAINAIGEDAVEATRSFYESRGINLTYEQAMDEVAADFTEALLTDKSKIERLVSDNRTLAQRFFDAVKEFVAKVKAAFKGKAAQDSAALNKYGVTIEQLEKATEIWENALKSTAETVRMSEGRGLKNLPPKDSVSYSLKDSEYEQKFITDEEGKVHIRDVSSMAENDWNKISKGFRQLGYDVRGAEDAKRLYSRYDKASFNDDQVNKLKQIFGTETEQRPEQNINKERAAKAARHFGLTSDFREAGYILHNGNMLDFSGKKDGWPRGQRAMDHREISPVFDDQLGDGYSEYMIRFMNEGNIRMSAGTGVDIGPVEPTAKQYTTLRNFIDNQLSKSGYFVLDLSSKDGYTVDSREYEEGASAYKIINDIKAYFKDGELPPESQLSKFRYSLKDSEGNDLTPEQAEFFKDSVIRDNNDFDDRYYEEDLADGRIIPVYHVTDSDFTVFDKKRLGEATDYNADDDQLKETARLGFWFSAKDLTGRLIGKNTLIAYLNLKNPYYVETLDSLLGLLDEYETGKRAARALQRDGYDGIVYRYDQEFDNAPSFIAFSPEQIKSIDNKNPTTDPDIRYSLKDSGYVPDESNTAKWTPERIDRLFSDYAATSPNYSKAYATFISPNDFLSLTTRNMARIESESRALDIDELRNETQMIHLTYNPDSPGEVWGHEGRHRMVALRNAGINKVAISVEFLGEKGKQNRQPIDELTLIGEDFSIGRAPGEVTLTDLVPISQAHRSEIESIFGASEETAVSYSLKGSKDAERRIAKLTELNQRLKEQMKVTKLAKTDRKALESLAREIIREYDIKMNAKDLVADLDEIYTFMANGKDSDGNDLTWEALKEKAVNLGHRLVRNASVLSNELQDDYRDMVRYFKGTRVKVSERNGKPQYKYEGGVKLKLADRYKSDMNDFNYFRKKHMGKFTLSNDGTPIDMVYAELCDVFPGYFNEDRHMTQPDQLQHIADVMDQIKPEQKNPYAGQMKEAAEIMANDIIEQFYELPQQAPTFADKQARKYTERVVKDTKKLQAKNERIAELIEDGRKRVKDILRRETERREAAITKIKERYQAKDAKTRDLQQRRELRNKIKRQINTLSQMLLRPSDTKHIPEALRKPVSEFLASIDLSTDRMSDNTLRRLDKLKSAYQKILDGTSDVQAEIDPDIIAKIEELSDALETKKLSELSRDELQNLWEITKGMRKTVTDYNKLFAQNIRETVSEMGTAAINEQGTKAYTESALRIKQSLANLVNMDMLDSFSFFEQLGPAMQRLFQNIRDGLDVKIVHTKEAADYMIDLLRDTKIDEWTGSKAKAKTFVTSVGKISLTPSQVMSLYLLNRQPDAQNHMYAGGIKAAPVVTRAGKNRLPKITKSFETLKVTPNDIDNIINSLSAEQKRIAEGISKFFTDYTAKWGNEVSMTLYGYEKFMVEKYFPIVSDRNYISQVFGEVTDKTLKNMGSTKARIEGASNPIIVEDAFDVFTRQADAMASYHAFVVPLTDIQRVWNFKTLDGSVKQAIEKRYGQRVLNYFSRLITDINGGARVEAGSEFVNTLIGRYKASRVGMNLRVVVQQPTSIIRASVMIDPKYLAKGATKKGNWNTVLKYAPIAQWKDWGYFNLYTGKQLKDIFLNKHRASDTFMWAAGKADQLAWQAMWNACEYEVQDTHPSLTKGSEEYYQAVASRFSDIIDRTQVVDSVLHRTQILRSKDTLVKMSVAFMTEPMKTYNLFRLAAQDYMQNKTPDAKKRVVRTVIGLAATAIINSAIASLVDALRDDEDELSYWEKWLNSFADDVKWVVPEMFPYVKDLTSMLRGYDIKRMDMAAIGDFFNSVKMLASDKYTPVAKAANIIAKSADLFGIPASAIKREISTVINNVEGVFESELFEYYMETIMYDIDSTNNRSRYYDLVYRAWQKEDKYEFNKIVADLLKHGYTKDTIENAIQSRAKKSKEYVQEQANVYTPVADSLKSHEFYNTLSDRYKDKADDYAKQYANAVALKSVLEPNPDAEKIDDEIEKLRREMGDDYYNPDIQAEIISMELEKGYTPQKWVLGADGTDKYYFEPAKYILYRVALQMVDESNDNNSSYSTKDRKAAMNLVGLNKEEQRYLEWLNKQ